MNNLQKILGIDIGLSSKTYKKGSVLQREGDSISKSFIVLKGLLRSYTIDEKGKEHIFMFGPENWIVSDMESQAFNKPAALFIDCLEDSEVIPFNSNDPRISNLNKEQLQDQFNLLSRRVGVLQRRVINLMSSTAIERYQSFVATYPELPNRVPQKMIASYLGITPEALSKLRGILARS